MINALMILLAFQLLGEFVVVSLQLPIPGPVVGMVLLTAALLFRNAVPQSLHTTATALLRHLSLLYIPAGVGIIARVGSVGDVWLPLLVTLTVSTVITLMVTALTMQWLLRMKRYRDN
jgi:holin-like protein